MGLTFIYDMDGNLYVNLTNRCCNACDFCIRNGSDGIGGHHLWLDREPSAQEVIAQMEQTGLNSYKEVVFCGFGEPMERLDAIKTVAAYVKQQGKPVRINTNGLANLMYGRDVTPELAGLVDTLSISLNASDAKVYDAVCHSKFGPEAFEGMLAFAEKAAAHVPNVLFSVVDTIGEEEIARCRQIAERCGVKLRVREWIEPDAE
ncbi:MAG: radical SAM protein [Clostridia bacterium]|nr:radical SAM protein [Clostridia bacterium]